MNHLLQNGLASLPSGVTDGLSRYLGDVMLEALPSLLLYALLGFALAVALCVSIGRKGLLSRKPLPWNVLAKLSYVAVLAALVAGGAAYGAFSHLHDRRSEGLSGAVEPAIRAQMEPGSDPNAAKSSIRRSD
jgi:drug/metabolite transporter (DMT)-like permease